MGKKIGSDEDRIAMRAQIHSAEKEIDLRYIPFLIYQTSKYNEDLIL